MGNDSDGLGNPELEPEPLSDKPEELHKEYRSLSTLLVLATAFNNGGEPILKLDSKNDTQWRADNSKLSKDSKQRQAVLDATAILCVRDTEVVAVTAQSPSISSTGISVDMVAVQDFAMVQNPSTLTDSEGSDSTGHCELTPPGTSHWPLIRDSDDPWCSLTIP